MAEGTETMSDSGREWPSEMSDAAYEQRFGYPRADQPKKQELPPEDAAYLKQAEEFLTQSAKMGNAPLAYMIAAAFKNEAANKKLRADNEAKDARIAELERTKQEWALQINAQSDKEVQLLAKIEKLEDRITISCGRQESFKRRAQSAEAQLKSVDGLLEEKLKSWSALGFGDYYDVYAKAEVDALLARIREAVKGDK